MDIDSIKLRQELDRINFKIPPQNQKDAMIELAKTMPHSCIFVESFEKGHDSNCFMYAVGLHRHEKALKIRQKNRLPLDHLLYLLEQKLLIPIDRDAIQVGDIVHYLAYEQTTIRSDTKTHHAGIVVSTNPLRIRSKWGQVDKCVWEHDLDQVPAIYQAGDKIIPVFFRPNLEKFSALADREYEQEIALDAKNEAQKKFWNSI